MIYGQEFNDYFKDNKIRFKYSIKGNASTFEVVEREFYKEGAWANKYINLNQYQNLRSFLLEILDVASDLVIFRYSFSSLFEEWQQSSEAENAMAIYPNCLFFPEPKSESKIQIFRRDTMNVFQKIYETSFLPNLIIIDPYKPEPISQRVINYSLDTTNCINLVMFSEGYTKGQEEKFYSDAMRFSNHLFIWSPYCRYKNAFQISAVFVASENEGTNKTGTEKDLNTVAGTHFHTFGIERYLTLPDVNKVYDYLSDFHVDQLCVLVNSSDYGGAGIFNNSAVFTVDNAHSFFLFLHEFGHSFAGLGDEYYSSEVSYIPKITKVEPFQPNITNLANFSSKWKKLINESIPIPTPDLSEFDGVVGLFEGANYKNKGYYRAERDCAMKSTKSNSFCKVCQISIEESIQFYIN